MSNNKNLDPREVNDQNNQAPINQIGIKLDTRKRLLAFFLLAATNVALNMDHGTIPAASNEIKQTLQINETTLGAFGSLVYLGNLIGALLLTKIIDIVNRKALSISSTIINGLLIYSFTKVNNIPFLFINRICVGIMQSFITVYFPVWIDQFGPRTWKTIMMAVFNITSPLGVVFGYILTMVTKVHLDWKVSYSIQVVILLLLSIAYFAIDDILFSKDLYLVKINQKYSKISKSIDSVISKNDGNKLMVIDTPKEKNEEISVDKSNHNEIEEQDLDESFFAEMNKDKKESLLKRFCDIVKVPVYIFTCIAITTLLFISTAVIFWASDFSINVLHGDHDQVLGVFVVVCVTGPVAGIIIGGALVQKLAGGYEGKHSITISLIYASLAVASSIPIIVVNSIYQFGVCLWAVLFFGGAVIPNLQGIMISSLDTDLRASGNSVSNIFQNLLGFLPAPFIYGLIYDHTKSFDQRLAMTLVLWYSFIGVIFIALALFYRFKVINVIDSKSEVNSLKQEISLQKISIDVNAYKNINVSEEQFEKKSEYNEKNIIINIKE